MRKVTGRTGRKSQEGEPIHKLRGEISAAHTRGEEKKFRIGCKANRELKTGRRLYGDMEPEESEKANNWGRTQSQKRKLEQAKEDGPGGGGGKTFR